VSARAKSPTRVRRSRRLSGARRPSRWSEWPRAWRGALHRVPTAAWICAALAFVNAACWSLIMPPFQALDEPDHFAYVQQLVENGRLPSSAESEFSPEEQVVLEDLHQAQVRFRPAGHPIFSRAQRQRLEADLGQAPSRSGPGGAGVATSEPPLYYALQTIPYSVGAGGSILDRLQLMRLLSALLGAVTALFVFMFVREALPGAPWAWTVGGLGAALGPLFGFSTGALNPDALLFAVSAAIFYCLARAFRRGLSQALALTIGGLCAAGFLTKLNFLGLAPGVLLALVLLARRQARQHGPAIYRRRLAPALSVALAPGLLYAAINRLSNHRTFGLVSSGLRGTTATRHSLLGELSYIWQLYLPRLPGMHPDFGPIFTTRQIWFRDVVGLYGWGDTVFPGWVYDVAIVPAAAIAILCVRALVHDRAALRARLAEALVYALISLGVLALVGAASYVLYPGGIAEFADARYLLPMLAIWAAILALAARGAGRRYGPAVGAVLVVLVISHDLFAQLQVLARYFG
jgi:4-amino-4-deoxy-L-arabinose transferase-like glycosyltransferase